MKVSELHQGDLVIAVYNIELADGSRVPVETLGVVISPVGVASEPADGIEVKWVITPEGEVVNKLSFAIDGDVVKYEEIKEAK